MKIVFLGSNDSSVEFLRELIKNEQVTAVVTRPDKPSGRGLEMHSSPVKIFSQKNNIPVLDLEQYKALPEKPGLAIAVAYGKILKKETFSFPVNGTINIHFSLLPKYRGASPMQWAIINGENTTGVTSFFIDEGLDTGNIILQKEVNIEEIDDFPALEKKMNNAGIAIMNESIELIKKSAVKYSKQSGTVTNAPPLKKSDGIIHWQEKTAVEVFNLIKGTRPWPGAHTALEEKEIFNLKIIDACPFKETEEIKNNTGSLSGEITALIKGRGFVVKCKESLLEIKNVQRENRKPMAAWDFWQGARMKIGDRFK
ncbi:MAG: methionyl-tRNA formyltransferase [Elusimicrobia bacterium RIFOXYA2_FULL_39_19]|nr:MAG: methionyl-tRNA formyltransferase [Elusimicrobia bacterium RIFOXYA2_FULL_39_19]